MSDIAESMSHVTSCLKSIIESGASIDNYESFSRFAVEQASVALPWLKAGLLAPIRDAKKNAQKVRNQRRELRFLHRTLKAEIDRRTEYQQALRAIAAGPESHYGKALAEVVMYDRRIADAAKAFIFNQDDLRLHRLRNAVRALIQGRQESDTLTAAAEEQKADGGSRHYARDYIDRARSFFVFKTVPNDSRHFFESVIGEAREEAIARLAREFAEVANVAVAEVKSST